MTLITSTTSFDSTKSSTCKIYITIEFYSLFEKQPHFASYEKSTMATSASVLDPNMKKLLLLQWLVVVLFISISLPLITADDDDSADRLLQNINSYRHARNLSLLTQNENAECFAEQIAEQFSNQICTNTTGEDTVPGTEPQLQNFPQLLANCHLNISGTREGAVLPNCVVGGNSDIAFENYTNGQYLQYLNDSKYVSAGVASENSWFVVVLATNTPNGNYQTYTSNTVHLKNKLLPFLPIMGILLLAI